VVGGGAGSRAAAKKEEEVVAGRRKMEIGEIIDFFFQIWLLISPLSGHGIHPYL
jgi:hypothetical protein